MNAGAGIAAFCHKMYEITPTGMTYLVIYLASNPGLPFEAVQITSKNEMRAKTSYYLQRPGARCFVSHRLILIDRSCRDMVHHVAPYSRSKVSRLGLGFL